jgi:hypothetical protein
LWAAFALAFALLIAIRRWLPVAVTAAVCVLLVVADAAHVFHGYQPMVPESAVFPTTPAVDFLKQHAGPWRVTALAPAMPADTGSVYGLHDVLGLDPPQPSIPYFRLLHLENPDLRVRDSTHLSHVTPLGRRALDLLSVRYVLTGKDRNLRELDRVYNGDDASIFENRHVVARASVPMSVTSSSSDAQTFALLRSSRFTAGRDAVTDGSAQAGSGTASVTRDTAERVTIEANMRARGLVVLADQWSRGWTVTVDGHDRKEVRVDASLRGVVVDAGKHTVVWHYRTPGLMAGTLISITTLVAGLVWLWLWPRRRSPANRIKRDDPIASSDGSASARP